MINQNKLNPLQNAYLLGRTNQLPLGCIAMHDFREFRGNIEYTKFKKIIANLTKKYKALRIKIDIGKCSQYVLEDAHPNLDYIDFKLLTLDETFLKLKELEQQISHTVHDLSLPPWRMWFIQLPDDMRNTEYTNIIYMSFDALILDGYSISVLIEDIFESYMTGEVKSTEIKIPTYQIDFFSNKQQDVIYWHNKLKNISESQNFPWKQKLETIRSSSYKRESVHISKRIWQNITKLATDSFVLPSTAITGIILNTLSMWTTNNNIYVAIPVSDSLCRNDLSNKSSFIVVQYQRENKKTFLDAIHLLQNDVMESLQHISFSGVELGRFLANQTKSSIPLPIVMTNGLTWKKTPKKDWMYYYSGVTQTPQIGMDIRFSYSTDNDLQIDIDYAEKAINTHIVQDILKAIKTRIEQIAVDQNFDSKNSVNMIQFKMPEKEVFEQYNDHFLNSIANNLFTKKIDRTALICDQVRYSYNDLANVVHTIMQNFYHFGVKKGQVVAICLPKKPEHIMVTLACALSGIIWVPIDVDAPNKRIKKLLFNCDADWCVGLLDNQQENFISIDDLLLSNDNDKINIDLLLNYDKQISDSPAYYLYTSGSTGFPKCVVLNNMATSNVIWQTIKQWSISARDVLLNITPLHHDMSIFEIFTPYVIGGTLVLPLENKEKDAISWSKLVEAHKVTIWSSVPAIVEMLLACMKPEQLKSLRLIGQGGDFIKIKTIEAIRNTLSSKVKLYSLGGPTETTVWNIWHEISEKDISVIPYGKPVSGNKYFILNENLDHCPCYVIGTMYASGINLSNGYLSNGKIKTDGFVTIKNHEGISVRAFKTNDQGYFREDGSIIFQARKEGYFKIRGTRISSAEIEMVMNKHPDISAILASIYMNPKYEDAELVAVYMSKDDLELDVGDLREFAKIHLPLSHIPTKWLHVLNLPMNRNGKPDRVAITQLIDKMQIKY